MTIKIKRIYEPPASTDGMRILVDRLWPRGIAKAKARIDLWQKEAAPSAELRRWFGHKPERWAEFRSRYRAELAHNPAAKELRKLTKGKSTTLLFGARDEAHNQAVVLAAFLSRGRTKRKTKTARR